MALGARASSGPGVAAAASLGATTDAGITSMGGGGSAPTTLDTTGSFPGLDLMLAYADYAATLQAHAEAPPPPAVPMPCVRFLANSSTPSTGGSATQGLTGIANLQDAIAGLNTMSLHPPQQQHGSPGGPLPAAAAAGGHTMGLSQDVPMWDLLASAPATPAKAAVAPPPPPPPPLGWNGLRGDGGTKIQVMAATAAGDTASLYVCGLPPGEWATLNLYRSRED